MQMVIYLVAGLSLTWILYQLYVQLVSKSIEGRRADELQQLIPALEQTSQKALIYCFSEACAPCRNMSPLIDKMHAEGKPIFKVDIVKHVDLAKDIGVQGVPTLLLIDHGIITKVILGTQNRTRIEALLET